MLLIGSFLFLIPTFSHAAIAGQGMTSAQLLRVLGVIAAALGVVLLILVEFVWRDRFSIGGYHWLLFAGLFLLPVVAILGTTATVFEETKTVESCNSCHVMEPFVNDLKDPHSPTLAARHYRNKWIPENQCYHCHTTYGIHGTLAGKRDGFRHWLLYVTGTYQEPVQYSGSYPNENCLACHSQTSVWEEVRAHQLLKEDLTSNRVGCYTCHGPVHPAPPERTALQGGEG
ncbi:MAG: hypothetical protein KatS3mg115_1949 [Candidatus Poribacteria bacterium]|nr:MAG: hypothetical protein KatS3mg115_1949 [Candidatus Poribacteria bacterium]